MKDITIAVAGTGFAARTIIPCFKEIPCVKIVAISGGLNKEKTRSIAKKFHIPIYGSDFSKLFLKKNLDLISIASPHQHHYEMVNTALDNDINIICEKPLGLNLAEIENLIAKSNLKTKLHLINHQLRFNPLIKKIRELIKSDYLGEIYRININYKTNRYINPETDKNYWWFDPENGGGMIIAMGSHLIDLIQFWFGNIVEKVYCNMHPVLSNIPVKDFLTKKLKAESEFSCSLLLKNQISVILTCSAVSYTGNQFEINILGDNGELTFIAPNQLDAYKFENENKKQINLFSNVLYDNQRNGAFFHYSFKFFANALIKAISSNDAAPVEDATTFEDYLYKYKFLTTLKESDKKQKVINLF